MPTIVLAWMVQYAFYQFQFPNLERYMHMHTTNIHMAAHYCHLVSIVKTIAIQSLIAGKLHSQC